MAGASRGRPDVPVRVSNADSQGTLLRQPLHTFSRVPRLLAPPLECKPTRLAPPQHALRERPPLKCIPGKTFPRSVRRRRRRTSGCPTSRWYTKLPDASGSGQLPPSPRSPRVIVLAPHVDGLVHVALRGRLLARALHRGEDRAGRSRGGWTPLRPLRGLQETRVATRVTQSPISLHRGQRVRGSMQAALQCKRACFSSSSTGSHRVGHN